VTIERVSSVYRSEPVGVREQPEFWNLVVRGRTRLAPEALLAALKAIERALGRQPAPRYGPRPIDIDILMYDDVRLSTRTLEIPHPRMLEREFVLRPLAELEPELRHPATGRRIADHLAAGLAAGTLAGRAEPIFPGTRLLEPAQHEGGGAAGG